MTKAEGWHHISWQQLLQEHPSSAWCKLGATQGIPGVSSAILPLMLP